MVNPVAQFAPAPQPVPEQELEPRYSKMICFNCGEPGHFVGNCVKPKFCFICNLPGHPVYNCPDWSKDHPSAAYYGSASKGLGFYHIDVPEIEETRWLNFNNCGLVNVKKGSISLSELEKDLSAIFCKNKRWPWQIRELDPKNFLVRFPPWKNVSELSEFPAFDLEKEGVNVKITSWTGEVSALAELQDFWVTVKGIPPKWCAWKTFGQLASMFGILMDVDWSTMFKSFYAEIKLLISCRDPSKIPKQRIVEMNQKLYLLLLSVEGVPQADEDGIDPEDDLDDDNGVPDQNMDTDPNQRASSSPSQHTPADNSHSGSYTNFPGMNTASLLNLTANVDGDCLSWNGFFSKKDMSTCLSPPRSLPGKMDYSQLDDRVWDWDSMSFPVIDVDDVDNEALEKFGESANLMYCSQMLKDMEAEVSDDELEGCLKDDLATHNDEDVQMESLDQETILKLSAVKRTLLPFMDDAAESVPVENVCPAPKAKKSRWGPVVATRKSARNHGNMSIIEKAKEYQKKKNLEIPSYFRGNSLAWCSGSMAKDGHRSGSMEDPLQRCSIGPSGEKCHGTQQTQGGTVTDCLDLIHFKPDSDEDSPHPAEYKEMIGRQNQAYKLLILGSL